MSQSLVEEFENWIDDLLGNERVPTQTVASARATLQAYRDDSGAVSAWTGLTKAEWCERLELLLANPSILNQRPTSYCMPAACLYVLFKRVPAIMAEFCVGLARDGSGSIGDLEIVMTTTIREYDIAAYAREHLTKSREGCATHPVDYALLLAMQEAMSITDLNAPDSLAASPGFLVSNVENLLAATDLFVVKRQDDPKVDAFATADGGTDAILIGSISLFSYAATPDHAAVLVPPIEVVGNQVTFRFWSWGMFQGEQTLPIEGDAYVSRTSKASFEGKLDAVIFATLKS